MSAKTSSTHGAKRPMTFADFHAKYGTIAIFVVLFVLASVFTPNFIAVANLTNVVRQMVVVTLLAFGVGQVEAVGRDARNGQGVYLSGLQHGRAKVVKKRRTEHAF